MRTSLNEIRLIDEHLFNNGQPDDALLFDAMRIINPALNRQITLQAQTHILINNYSRKKLKAEIESAHQKLFNEPAHLSFKQRIMSFFKS